MFTFEEIKAGLCWWAIFGFFYVAIAQPSVINKKQAILYLIASGPLCWVMVAGFGIKHYLEGFFNATH